MYFQNIDNLLKKLIVEGAVKLPSIIDASWRQDVYEGCLEEIGNKSYAENLPTNLRFLNEFGILSQLLPKLASLAKENFGITVNDQDVYNVCRLVRPGDESEGYRGHFDSHLFTLVTPINIPDFNDVDNCGQLHYFPMSRGHPKNEFNNVIMKAFHKQYNSAEGFDRLAQNKTRSIDDFKDYSPLLFLGNTTFHGNAPVQATSRENRMTLLTHFFDPSPKFGVGTIMRRLRRR